MKIIVTLSIIFSLLLPSGLLFGQKRKGAELLIMKTDRTQIEGELIAVKRDTSLLLNSYGNVPIDIADINFLEIIKTSKAAFLIVPGLVIGGIVGAKAGQGFGKIATGFVGAILGGAIGLCTGDAIGRTEIFPIAGKSPKEIKEVLNKLRSKARFPDYQ